MRHDLSRDELIELARRIMATEGTEHEIDEMIRILEANVPHPEVTNLMFWPKSGNPTPEQVVDEALAYKPIAL